MTTEQKYYAHTFFVVNLTLIFYHEKLRRYTLFGETLLDITSTNGNYYELRQFGGHHFDQESGMLYMGARYNNTELGIEISTDDKWYLFPHLSPYNYCSNNPVMRIDPTGMTDFEVNGERKTIDDGRNNVTIKATERQYNKAQKRFADGERSYEKYLNKLSKSNEYTTVDIGYVTNEENYIIGIEVTITNHNSESSSIDWDEVVQNADDFFVVAAMADAQLPFGDALGVLWKGATRIGRFLFGGAKGVKGVQTTLHGAERVAGVAATRGGVLSVEGINATKTLGRVFTQADGATVFLHEVTPGRFNAVVQGNKGIITTMENWSQKSINRIAKNYEWKPK
jgi:RHS repeat-associated protein